MPQLSVSAPAPELTPQVAALVARYAPHNAPVVITGPIGVGKTHLARVIHDRSGRVGEFVPVPLTSLQPGFENVTMAGHDKGAYTGSHRQRNGLLTQANRGTLFLDEIGDGSIDIQRVLLELLTDSGLRRLGEERRVRYDLRFIVATHIDLDLATAEGRFREDLLSRLGNCWIQLSPLRERPEEIPALLRHHLARLAAEHGRPQVSVSEELLAVLVAAPWIYNVRGLVSECQALYTAVPAHGVLGVEHLSARFWSEVRAYLRSVVNEAQRLELALKLAGDRRAQAAELLDVTERTVYRQVSHRPK